MKTMKIRPKTDKGKRGKTVGVEPSYVLEPLDPWLRCGPDTTVTELWKVRERRDGVNQFHLVYFDRYGWYCEHGRGCKAVAEVRRVVRTMNASGRSRTRTGIRLSRKGF